MNQQDFKKLLELFELNENFTLEQLKLAYRDLLQIWHPDKYSHNPRIAEKATIKTKEINEGYNQLKDYLSKLKEDSHGIVSNYKPPNNYKKSNEDEYRSNNNDNLYQIFESFWKWLATDLLFDNPNIDSKKFWNWYGIAFFKYILLAFILLVSVLIIGAILKLFPNF